MIKRMIAGVQRALGLNHPGPELLILPDDVFLTSFPKSGNTWTRFLIANLVFPEQRPEFGNIRDLIPDPADTPRRRFDRMPRPRVIKSHDCFDPRYPKVIYIVRDPRDVVISQYHYHRKIRRIDDNFALTSFVSRFVAGKTCPNHGSWGENVATWLVARYQDPRFLLLRYEDMLSDTPQALSRIASFLNIVATPELISQAIERSSVTQMRNLEARQSDRLSLTKGSRQDLSFVRSAKSGEWRANLPDTAVAEIETAWGRWINFLGYELHFPSVSRTMDPVELSVGKVSP